MRHPLQREVGSVISLQPLLSQSHIGHKPYLTSSFETQVPVFISHRDRVAQSYLHALLSLFVAVCDSQGYSGAVLSRFHAVTDITRYERHRKHRSPLSVKLLLRTA
jgi:hypothetical protein